MRPYRDLLLTYLGPQWPRVLLLGLLLAASLTLELLNPQLLSRFIDRALAGEALSALTWMATLYLLVALGVQAVALAETYIAADVGLIATNRLRADLTRHVLQLDPAFHNTHTPGELIERVDGDVTTLNNFFSRFVVNLLGNALLLLGVLALLFGIDWRVGAGVSALAITALLALNAVRGFALPRWEAARQTEAELYGFIEERLSGTEDIRANGAVAYVLRRLFERERAVFRRQLTAAAWGIGTGSVSIVLLATCSAVGLGLGIYLYQLGEITLGTIYLIFTYTALLNRPIDQITRQMEDLQKAGAGLGRINALRALQSAIVEASPPQRLPDGPLAVEFDSVSFGYDPQGRNLHEISFALPPGRVLGLLGRTGSGKTTLTRLLFRLYDPSHGALYLGEVDLREASLDELRRKVGMVTQDIQLFHASVRDNLTFFDPAIVDDDIVKVLDELGLRDWYDALPEGLNTRLAAGGGGLSAGQAQLLAFARIFLKNPGLVILDEASSRLDPATEQKLERAIDKLLAGRTVIIIAHRLGTVQRADDILILEQGQMAEFGPREQLANDPASRFAELLRVGLETTPV
jgi:ATP-binding cassette, subfamily B, bacterial